MSKIPTPHIIAQKEDIADVVIMPGDPKRSGYIAERFLEDARLVNDIRGVQGYTGKWKGKMITTMASGVGIPSISVYAYELFNFYDIAAIIRVGTAGSIQPQIRVGEILLAETAYTNSGFLSEFSLEDGYIATADASLLAAAERIAKESGIDHHKGAVLTQEIYYSMKENIVEDWAAKGVMAFEMEAAALYANADQAGKKALAILTASNSILDGTEMDPMLRERALDEMIELALDTALEI